MKIIAKKNVINDTNVYKYQKPQYCCKMLENNPLFKICDEQVSFEVDDCGRYIYSNDNQFCMCLCHSKEVPIPYEDSSWEETSFYLIKYCPFCGEPIEIVISSGEDLSEQYGELEAEYKLLEKKYNKSDSIKKCKALSLEMNVINGKMDKLCSTSEE